MSKHFYPSCSVRPLALIVLLSVWCVVAKPASAQRTQTQDKPDSVHGVVVNSVTHEPIGRALVFSPDNRFATMTDSEGRFSFTFAQAESDKNQANGSESADASGTSVRVTCGDSSCNSVTSSISSYSYRRTNRPDMLMARKPGFLNDHTGTQNLQSDTTGKEVTIALTPEALVVGRFLLPTTEASDTIQVELYRRQVQEGRAHWFPAGSVSTKSNGEFRFAELSAGTYKLLTLEQLDRDPLTFDPQGQLYGYPPVYFPNATDFAGAQAIQITAGQIFQADISLVRHAYYPVKVAAANAPHGGMGIVVSAQGHRGPGYSLGFNDHEQTIEGMLPNGNYTLEAASFAGPNTASGLLNISVKGAAVEGSRMTMVPNGSISVSVKEEFTVSEDANSRSVNIEGPPVSDNLRGPRRYLNVRLEPADDFGHERSSSIRPPSGPEDDSLTIDNVQPGRYWVRASASRGFVASVTSGATDLQHHPLVVGLGGSSSPIEITMRDEEAQIDGTIQGAAAPFSGPEGTATLANGVVSVSADLTSARVYCVPLPDGSGEFREVWVAPDGKFGPQPLPPGTYRLLALDHPQPELEYGDPEAMRAYDAKGQLVRLVPGQKEHLQLQLTSSNEQP
jgi:hypothetical protein